MAAARQARCLLLVAVASTAGCGAGVARDELVAGSGMVLLANTALDTRTQLELAAGLIAAVRSAEPRSAPARTTRD